MFILIDVKEVLGKIQHPFIIFLKTQQNENLQKSGKLPQYWYNTCIKNRLNTTFNDTKFLDTFKWNNEENYSLS